MKNSFYVFVLIVFNLTFMFSQGFQSHEEATQFATQEVKSFQNYALFSSSNQPVPETLRDIATDASFLEVDNAVLAQIQQDKPQFIQFQLQHGSETFTVKMQRQEILTEDFIVRNENDEILDYNPGLYYRGIVNEDRSSLVVFNLFSESVNGVISQPNSGNRIIGQLQESQNYVIYTDSEMTVKQNFICEVDELAQETSLPQQGNISSFSNVSTNCVRVFYELTNDVYSANSSSVSDTTNWITSVHNIVATLYSDSNITTALSDVLIWQQNDPYSGNNGNKLSFFRDNRIAFNGDLAHLIDFPATGGVAYLNSLCQSSRYAFSGASVSFQQLPTYSWSVNVIAHEMGHSLGSPHTHACFWNNNNTAIDACGPDNGYSEGCDNGPIPSNGGTVMSYCHLDSTGVNLALGFHPQVGSYMSTNIDTKSCLGTDCINSCMQTIAGVSVTQTDLNSFTVNIDDVISNSWDYRIFEQDASFPGGFTTTNTNSIVFNNVQPNTYYVIQVGNNCSNGNIGSSFVLNYLSDDDWCSSQTFTDTGGLNEDYGNNELIIKTFYPNLPGHAIALDINALNLESGFDFMTIYDGESTNDLAFAGGLELTGSNPTTTFFQATNSAGAITVEFTSDFTINTTGWDITVSCVSLSTNEFSKNEVSVYPNPVDNLLNISSKTALSQLIIYDIKGKIVSKKSLNQELDTKMDLGSLGSGVYFIKLISENSSIVKRVIKR
ncbi:M12 family metallo-peptidase [Mesohalobacter halotolerans]|uniref:T9SS type A sorting domain-containing protein n=1 Tax=Mesohalobacter halotolerans TaxID=1883405 RepID=A0A4U5TS83_9FLAO|nr:M12 family metallo-peptidase [Mesohalobacter halotolerans]MBS3738872.1 T9SS type A sorting domain-containing protein [Psychroflexus sp.]TKS57149.1 T9SS type A sorting domain-containing protein [Mesohalobacter halotolerans]